MLNLHNLSQLILVIFFLQKGSCGRQQQISETRYVIASHTVDLPCPVPGTDNFLKWKFQENRTGSVEIDAAQHYPGSVTSIFNQFNLPPGRSQLLGGTLRITDVGVRDEGLYWCEISGIGTPTQYSNKIPVHVWVTPLDPQVVGIGNGTVLEYTETAVARC
uniref:Immunoglobulin domain-containing protein n=1 Tax=Ciona savignyi TaxID=51511 RepID=H2ZC43_CIOSA